MYLWKRPIAYWESIDGACRSSEVQPLAGIGRAGRGHRLKFWRDAVSVDNTEIHGPMAWLGIMHVPLYANNWSKCRRWSGEFDPSPLCVKNSIRAWWNRPKAYLVEHFVFQLLPVRCLCKGHKQEIRVTDFSHRCSLLAGDSEACLLWTIMICTHW